MLPCSRVRIMELVFEPCLYNSLHVSTFNPKNYKSELQYIDNKIHKFILQHFIDKAQYFLHNYTLHICYSNYVTKTFFKDDKRQFGRNCYLTDRLIKSTSRSSLAKSRDQFLACGRFVQLALTSLRILSMKTLQQLQQYQGVCVCVLPSAH